MIVFSHGLGGMRSCNSAIVCDLASHGYVVAAVEHRYVRGYWVGGWMDVSCDLASCGYVTGTYVGTGWVGGWVVYNHWTGMVEWNSGME